MLPDTVIETQTLSVADILWDAESLTLDVRFAVPDAVIPRTPPLVSRVETAVGIPQPMYRLALGDLMLSGDSNRLLSGFDIRRAPTGWHRQSLDPIETSTKGAIRLDADFDENGLASVDADIDITVDDARGLLSIERRPCPPIAVWVEVAIGVVAGLDEGGGIAAFRLTAGPDLP
ncbi:hypothetical protein [uncultured Rhodospira sp.]|uniref:hypothetical protein n=1 Tax=uncultured Rhodospira sp. TaxID=1936189 RepID=UPI00261392B0|nr:hypothetical protein [uncultured Rhodospira sp.]